MITAHKLNGKEFVINCDQIVFVEKTPDTVITLANGEKVMVQESIEDIIEAVKKFKKSIQEG